MRRYTLIVLLCCCLNAVGQLPKAATTTPRPDPAKFKTYEEYIEALVDWKLAQAQSRAAVAAKPGTLAACRSGLRDSLAERDSLMSQLADIQSSKDALAKENAELQKKYRDAITILNVANAELSGQTISDDLKQKLAEVPKGEVLDLGISIENDQNKIGTLLTKLLEHDSSAVDKYNALLADHKEYVQHVSIQLVQIGQANRVSNALALYNLMPKYTPPQTIQLNVSDCTKLPALCVH